jgi:glycosyltransferase involved in cell wall biosynthesis
MTELEKNIKNLEVCLVIPTYNHATLLEGVIKDCLLFPIDIIMVNDGSTDHTLSIINKYENKIKLVSYEKNRGKGYALKQGAKKAAALGYKAIITMDSDGQHFASDIETLVNAALKNPKDIIVGSRGLEHENMPKKNTFANKFANFWFCIQTFQKIPDTQSGFRYYPLQCFNKKVWFTNRYNFELEIMVRNVWSGIMIIHVPIQVYYAPVGERITHFKPSLDFFRISVLNTFLTIFALIYFYPKKLMVKVLFLLKFCKKDNKIIANNHEKSRNNYLKE